MLVVFYPLFSFQNVCASTYPQIISVDRTPLAPIPDLEVNVTFQVVDIYGLTNSSLYYAVNSSSGFNQVKADIIDGDYQNGTFAAQIPSQPDNTKIQYFIKVKDSIGYIAQSLNYSYVVSMDTTPPNIVEVDRLNPSSLPVLPSENVTISALISDDGSGVRNASLFYGIGNDPYDMNYNQTQMVENNPDNYTGTIPPFSNGTRVYYYVVAYDNSNNSVQENSRYNYFVFTSDQCYINIEINVKNIYMNNLTATVDISVSGMLPGDEQPLYIEMDSPPYYILQVNESSTQRFWYQGTIENTFYLSGNPNLYPYDSYLMNFSFKIFYSQPQSLKTSTFITQPFYRNNWNGQYIYYNTTDSASRTPLFAGYPVLVSTLTIDRNIYGDVFPLILLITMLFFVLGGTLLIDPTRLGERLTVLLTIFIFMAGFYFSQSSAVPSYGFTTAERLLLSLVSGSALFAVASLLSASVNSHLKNFNISRRQSWIQNILIRISQFLMRKFGLMLDALAIIALGFIWLFPIIVNLPWLEQTLIIFGILYGVVIRAVLLKAQSIRQKNDSQIV